MNSPMPDWVENVGRWYYSRIESQPIWHASVSTVPADAEVNDQSPGTLLLRMEPRWRGTRVLDATSREVGIVRSEGVVRGLRFVMRRSGAAVWSSAVRSVVRKHHRLTVEGGADWTFDTPFFWWHHYLVGLVGVVAGQSPDPVRWPGH
jgi:hypothetical protein